MISLQDNLLNQIGTISALAIAALMTIATIVALLP